MGKQPVLRCILADPEMGALALDVKKVNSRAALLDTNQAFSKDEYIDASLELPTGERHSLFAHVVSSGEKGLELRWLHFDPGEEEKLLSFIGGDASRSADTSIEEKMESARSGTRRVTKPRVKAADENSGRSSKSSTRRVVRPKSRPLEAAESGATEGVKRKTRRITQPRMKSVVEEPSAKSDVLELSLEETDKTAASIFPEQSPKEETNEFAPTEDRGGKQGGSLSGQRKAVDSGDTSGVHDVVLASTQRYEGLGSGIEAPDRAKPLTKRHNVVSKDGKLDVGASIRSRAKTVSASELAARHDRVRVLNMSTIKLLIQDAVAEAVEQLGSALSEKERQKLLDEAEDEFQERLKGFQAEKKGAEEQAKLLQEQLEKAESLLADERKRSIEVDQFTVSDTGMADMEKRFERIVQRMIQQNSVEGKFAGELESLVGHMLDEERERIAEQAKKAHGDKLSLLEKKVKRLASTLDETEKERDRAHRHLKAVNVGAGAGLGNVMEAGLDEDDPEKETKLSLLKDIFNQNKEMRDHLKESGRTIPTRSRPKPPPSAPKEDESDVEEPTAATEPSGDTNVEALAENSESAETELVDESTEAEDDYGIDPDDMPWEPGVAIHNVESELAAEDDDDSSVKKMTSFKEFKPPALERKKKTESVEPAEAVADTDTEPESDTEADETDGSIGDIAEEESDYDMDPDDMPWEAPSDVENDASVAEDNDPVKKMTDFKQFAPPPLERKK